MQKVIVQKEVVRKAEISQIEIAPQNHSQWRTQRLYQNTKAELVFKWPLKPVQW